MSDWLERATSATREIDAGGPGPESHKTQLAVWARARRSLPRRRMWWWGPLLALFAGSVAYAQGGVQFVSQWVGDRVGGQPDTADEGVAELLGVVSTIRPPLEASRAASSSAVSTAAPKSMAPAAPVGAASELAAVPTPHRWRPAAGTAAAPTEIATSEPRDEGWEVGLYRKAHRLHFDAGPSELALRSWDEYLAAAPNGVFALEARYNRGLVLLGLGRYRAAHQALSPFAAGQYGAYRRAEASRLLEELDRTTPP